ncbi:MAG: DUF4157 domain-containing protein, partial [Methanofastidiosum sp.]
TIGNRAVGRLLSEIGLISSKAKQLPPVQMQTIPEEKEEPLQGKMVEIIQRQDIPEEEEPLQGKFENGSDKETCSLCMQRQQIPEEEESLQGMMVGTIQRQEIPEEEEPLQTKVENNTVMSDNLKTGVENLSGIDMNDVRVHYNSDKPAEVGALAYTQGIDIHVAPGQERHLPHEAWHVVQQAQGRVQPTTQMKDVAVNDDVGLESEADVMGEKASQMNYSLHCLEDVNELPQIKGKENKRAQSQVIQDNTLMQLKIDWSYVLGWLEQGTFKEYECEPTDEKQRTFIETKMLIDELGSRYDKKTLLHFFDEYSDINSRNNGFIYKLITKLNAPNKVITLTNIRQVIGEVESEPGKTQTNAAKSQTKEEKFVSDLKEHFGYYEWEQGTHEGFIQNLNSQNPSTSDIPMNAQINCWEAVLFSAARTGFVDVGKLTAAYSDKEKTRAEAVDSLITLGKVVRIFKHYVNKSQDHANDIKVGDIIILEPFDIDQSGKDKKPEFMHHVVAVVKACPNDYFNIEVASLYNNLCTTFLTQFPLKVFLERDNYQVRVSTLSQSDTETGTTPLPSTSSAIPKRKENSRCCHCQLL